jgi:hypothetical protein
MREINEPLDEKGSQKTKRQLKMQCSLRREPSIFNEAQLLAHRNNKRSIYVILESIGSFCMLKKSQLQVTLAIEIRLWYR